MNILVTGGAGYIGSHTVRALMKSEEFTPFVFDNLSTGHRESVPEEVAFIEGDIHDIAFVAETMKRYEIDGVIHFAASSLVAESMVEPGKYYSNNVEEKQAWIKSSFLPRQRYMGSRRKHLLKKIFPIIRPMCMAGRNLSSRI